MLKASTRVGSNSVRPGVGEVGNGFDQFPADHLQYSQMTQQGLG